jgi:hypothetical protein
MDVYDLAAVLLRLAFDASLDRQACHQHVLDEAVVLLLGFPDGRDQDAVGRPSRRVIDLPLGQSLRGCTTATVALY